MLTSGIALVVGFATDDGTRAILIGVVTSVGSLVLLATGVARTRRDVSSSER